MEKLTAVVLGAGLRGRDAYGSYAVEHPEELQIVAVAEPDPERRQLFQSIHHLKDDQVFSSWEDLLKKPKLADACLVCTQDQDHFHPTMKALELGYHVLLEKPMAWTEQECRDIIAQTDRHGRVLSVCHVLRYTPFFTTMKNLLDAGVIGDIVTVEHSENVAYWHQAHSFVRGNWSNTQRAHAMIMAKSCHDMDILTWLIGKRCQKISSFGSLTYFCEKNAPKGATSYCLDGCPARYTCAFYAPRLYTDESKWQTRAIRKAVTTDETHEGLMKALAKSPYGRCVFRCDNDVVDHQVVQAEFEDEVTLSFTMTAFTYDETRVTRVLGTKGELVGNSAKNHMEYRDFLTGTLHQVDLNVSDVGHGGGDHGIVRDFIRSIQEGLATKSNAHASLQSHLMAFAAEKSRRTGAVISLTE